MILTSQDQLKNLDNVGAVLVYPSKITTSGLIQSALSNDLVVNCIVDEDPDNAFIGQSLSQLGYPSGCYIAINYQNKKTAKEITDAFSSNLQLGYRAAIIINKSDYTQDDFKAFSQYGIIVIDHKDIKDSLLNVPNFLKTRSVAMIRDYTNVDISGVGPGAFVGVGKDTSGLGGGRSFGYSTNGQDFYAVITPKGLVFRQIDALRMWRLLKPQQAAQIGDFFNNKVAKEIEAQNESLKSAVATANSAVNAANQAVNDSKVNSDAIKAMNSAIAAAQDDVNSATAAIQEVRANASSDAASIRSDVAKIESEVASAKFANQDSVNALQSDIDAAKKDLADAHSGLLKAQAAVEQNQKLINDSVAKINNDINQDRKDMAEAQQANADMAKKLNSYTNQAKEQGKTIEKLQTDDNGMKLTIADVKGNVSQVQDSVTGLTANLKDANDNLATVKALANSLSVTMTDHSKNINDLQVTAKNLSSILSDADGRLSKVEQTAKEHTSTFSDVQGNISQVKQTADGLADTLKDAQGNIDKVRATAKGLSEQISNAQGDITALQTDVSGIKATIADHEKNIHTLQVDSKSLTDNMTDAQGNISKFQKTATDLTNEMQDHSGRLSKVEQTASTLINEFSDQQGHLNRVEQTANGTEQTVANQQGQINTIKTDATGIHETLTGQGKQIATINVTLDGLKSKYEGVSGDLNKLKNGNYWKTVNGAFDANQYTQTAHIFYQDTQAKNTPDPGWFYFLVEAPRNDRVTQTLIKDNSENSWSRFYNGTWSAWAKGATQLDIDSLSDKININSTQITQNKKEIDLKADQSTLNNLTGEVRYTKAQLKVQADKISSKVSSEDFKTLDDKVGGAIAKIQKNSTTIDQNNKQISLKADQTEVDKIKGTAIKNSSRLDVMDDEIKSKVTSTDVNNIVDGKGYATTSTVQSLITQEAGTINESITNLTSKVNSNNGGGVNLLKKSEGPFRPTGVNTTTIADNYGIYDSSTVNMIQGQTYTVSGQTNGVWSGTHDPNTISNKCVLWLVNDQISIVISADTMPHTFTWNYPTGTRKLRVNAYHKGADNTIYAEKIKIERGTVATPWTPAPSDNATVTQVQQITASIDGIQSTVANKADKSQITQLSNLIQSKVSSNDFTSKISQLSNDINARVSKGDLMSQINIEAGRLLFQSNKIFLDADTIVFSKNSKAFIPDAAITNLSLDKLTTGQLKIPIADQYGNQIVMGNSGINISSAPQTVRWSNVQTKSNDEARFMINVAGKSIEFIDHVKYDPSVEHINKSDDFSFLRMQPDVLHSQDGSADQVASPSGMTLYVPTNISPETGPISPGGFLAVGYDETQQGNPSDEQKGIDIAYVTKPINGWEKGLTINTTMRMKPKGADHAIRTAWVSWSGWDNGERYPALIQDGANWGGIAFPKSGRVTLFDAYGYYYSPDRNTGAGPYNDYGG